MLNWSITFFLLAFVAEIFSVAGTNGETASQWGRIAAASLLILAVALLIAHLKDRYRHPDAG